MTLPELMILLLLSCRRVVLSGPAFRHKVKSQSTTASASPSVRRLPSCVYDTNGDDGRQPSPVDVAINGVDDGEGGFDVDGRHVLAALHGDLQVVFALCACALAILLVCLSWLTVFFPVLKTLPLPTNVASTVVQHRLCKSLGSSFSILL